MKNFQGSLADYNLLIHVLTRVLKARCMSVLCTSVGGNIKGRSTAWGPCWASLHLFCCLFSNFHGMHAACHVDFWRNQMSFRGICVCSKTGRSLIVKWIYVYHGQIDYLFHNNTSHAAQWMVSAFNVHPCISNPPSLMLEKQSNHETQPNSRV